MRDWNRLIADEQYWMTKHYTPGRSVRLRGIVLHHNAAQLSLRGCWDVWQTREASAHYQVDANGRIGQYVHDRDTAWHAGAANPWTIGIEHADATFAPSWTISEATLDNGAHLVAALCLAYGLGEPRWGVNVFPHRNFMQTACPGAIAGAQRGEYMARARYWFDVMAGKQPEKKKQEQEREGNSMYLLLIDEKWWAKTDGIHARLIQDTAYLKALTDAGHFPIVRVTDGQFRANYIEVDADVVKSAGRVKSLLDMATGSPKMSDWMKRTSLLRKIGQKLGIEERTA
ncbi:peptidoglycan recognition protein family protein [Mobiluncus mulieris]|uniref:N-acetylmuramoyl-L-alanine amidase n=1 Tax=Mobiluncus mulieris TaxID=2052 RepID=A0ABD4TWZ7_9ACTO|nr:peptidoglycan recognition family protein [Mobiluncus mulieris]MCU9969419.1 N-acetylmuramoyl-L-alanine amidase [Mobiluncus mulieris]MCU9973858.1 N-acetylmuramoyl-L-alanine amidase [Mobiluncus mulieris]MCV0009204.1 N-acetylmuramoyl-L-alanine amidase [Mobiluncus mulieris]NMX19044.1 N-acetylmuramoyl-L-alanine amidase [Mobiluncus mulieris]